MRIIAYIILIVGGLLIYCGAYAQDTLTRVAPAKGGVRHIPTLTKTQIDSILRQQQENNEKLYDSIRAKSKRGWMSNLLYDALFVSEKREKEGKVIDEAEELKRYNGKTIGEIYLNRGDVFPKKKNWFSSLVNGIHIRTLPSAIQRDLLFKTGDKFDSEVVVTSNHIIQNRSYISDSHIIVAVDQADTTKVTVIISTRDNWTIGIDGDWRKSKKQAMGYIYDVNFLGSGARVGTKTHLQYNGWKYGGNIFDYLDPNLFGTFFNGRITAGRDFDNSYLELGMDKAFILPTDYEIGMSFTNNKISNYKINEADNWRYQKVKSQTFDIWGGLSRHLKSTQSNIYGTSRFGKATFRERPDDTDARNHPAFHNYDEAMVSVGLYRERFYTSSMIYGYGFQEYISSGQKFELTGGLSWQEFGNYWYAGATFQKGGFTKIGYFRFGVSAGSYINTDDKSWWRTAIDADMVWFSNLLNTGQSSIRQFITLNYTQGWNQGTGAGSLIVFGDDVRPVTFDRYAAGSNRLLLSTETVVFTPLQPLGFRIALFGFADAGVIGRQVNPFKNDFYGTLGIGIRLKNERLVFSAIQFKFGIAFNKHGFMKNQLFRGSTEQRISHFRFIPTRPEEVTYY